MLINAQESAECIRLQLAANDEVYTELGRRLRALDPSAVATIARGSSDHAASFAAYLISLSLGKTVASVPPSLVSLYRAPLDFRGQFALAVSQSGRSPDLIATVEQARRAGALTAAIVNDVTSPVAQQAEFILPQYAGVEGIAATKSVLCTLTAAIRLVASWSQENRLMQSLDKSPDLLAASFQTGLLLDEKILQGVSHVYVLSRGLGLPVALETALKLKETCGLHAEAFSSAEVRHGPREIVDQKFLVIALALPGPGHDDVIAAAEELKAQGARVFLLGRDVLPHMPDERLAPLLMLQTLYPWFVRSSQNLGFDPDRPKTLKSKIVKTV